MIRPQFYALLWTWLMEEICTTKFFSIKRRVVLCLKEKYGITSFKSWGDFKPFMIWRLFIEISSVLTSSWIKTEFSSLEISMSLKSLKVGCSTLKQALHIMPAQKCGRISLMIRRVIYGVLAACSMSYVHLTLLSEPMIWTDSLKKLSKVNTHLFLRSTLLTWWTCLNLCFSRILALDPLAHKFLWCPELRTTYLKL